MGRPFIAPTCQPRVRQFGSCSRPPGRLRVSGPLCAWRRCRPFGSTVCCGVRRLLCRLSTLLGALPLSGFGGFSPSSAPWAAGLGAGGARCRAAALSCTFLSRLLRFTCAGWLWVCHRCRLLSCSPAAHWGDRMVRSSGACHGLDCCRPSFPRVSGTCHDALQCAQLGVGCWRFGVAVQASGVGRSCGGLFGSGGPGVGAFAGVLGGARCGCGVWRGAVCECPCFRARRRAGARQRGLAAGSEVVALGWCRQAGDLALVAPPLLRAASLLLCFRLMVWWVAARLGDGGDAALWLLSRARDGVGAAEM